MFIFMWFSVQLGQPVQVVQIVVLILILMDGLMKN